MAKGKKKGKGKKRGGKKIRDRDDKDNGDSPHEGDSPLQREYMERARLAAGNRKEDPLKNWTRPMQEECPICMLPLPYEANEKKYCFTCDKTVCMGCVISTCKVHRMDGADSKTAMKKGMTCPFCRSNNEDDDKFSLEKVMKRANAGNCESMCQVGRYYCKGQKGLRQDKAEGLKWYQRALEAGSGLAGYDLGHCYEGDGVDKDVDKALECFQKSADLGYRPAFFCIGKLLFDKGNIEEGMLNLRKALICGMIIEHLFDILRNAFRDGFVTKEEYAFTLRENQKACNEMKSEGRELWKTAL